MKYCCLILITCCIQMANANQAQAIYPFDNAIDSERFATLTNGIRCIVCQSQSIADSEAPLAKDLRQKIYHFVQAHKTDTEIDAYLRRRYGDYILFKPTVQFNTWLLWLFPFIGISAVVLLLVPMISGQRTRE